MSTPAIILNSSPATWRGATNAARRHVDLARISPRISDELRDRFRWNRRINFHDEGNGGDARHWCGVIEEIKGKIIVERRVDRVRRQGQKQRVAVRRCLHREFSTDIAGGTRAIVDDERLPELFRQPLCYEAPDDVRRTARGDAND
jgi:hypothetical protein